MHTFTTEFFLRGFRKKDTRRIALSHKLKGDTGTGPYFNLVQCHTEYSFEVFCLVSL